MPDEARRYFEDLSAGLEIELGTATVTGEEILEFARRYDPQPFHVDEAAGRESIYGGLIASGAHSIALFARLFVTGFLNGTVSLGSPGLDRVRFLNPLRPGDTLRGRWTITECRASASRPDRGIVSGRGELINQRGEVVLSLEAVNFIGRRRSGGG